MPPDELVKKTRIKGATVQGVNSHWLELYHLLKKQHPVTKSVLEI